ncbi:MAG: hypothetical protein KatS3mg011_0382 [Acidimicrobiia bacterium]|nr:MAG: hypothetical protein KatS3mg011_0382 [Acidimicrobiia bacterium]
MKPLATRTALTRLLQRVPSLRRGLIVTVGLAFVGTALQIAIPVIVQLIVDTEILAEDGVDLGGVAVKSGIALAAMGLATVARRQSTFRLARASAEGLSDLRVMVFRHLHRLSALHLESERRGALVARVTSDVYRIQDFMEWGGMAMLVGASQVVLAVAAMMAYRWQLALLVVAGVTVYGLMLFWFQRILARAHDAVRRRVADSMSAVGESISGLPVIRAYGVEGPTLHRVREAVDRQFAAEFRTFTLGSILFSSAELFAGLLTAGVVAAGVLLGPDLGMTTGGLLAFLFLVNLLVQPVQTLVETLDTAQAAAAGVRRVLEVLETPLDLPYPDPGRELPLGALDLAVEDLWFRYPGAERWALEDVRVRIPAGERVAVVGETGSGKTTFAKLVVRLMDPSRGRVMVGGVPLDQVAHRSPPVPGGVRPPGGLPVRRDSEGQRPLRPARRRRRPAPGGVLRPGSRRVARLPTRRVGHPGG